MDWAHRQLHEQDVFYGYRRDIESMKFEHALKLFESDMNTRFMVLPQRARDIYFRFARASANGNRSEAEVEREAIYVWWQSENQNIDWFEFEHKVLELERNMANQSSISFDCISEITVEDSELVTDSEITVSREYSFDETEPDFYMHDNNHRKRGSEVNIRRATISNLSYCIKALLYSVTFRSC